MMAPNVLSTKALSLLLVSGVTFVSLHCGGDGGGVAPLDEPAIGLSATSKSFSGTQGETAPAAQTVAITNAGVGTLAGLAAEVSYTTGQPEGWLSAELSATSAPSTLTLTAATGSLAPGTYTGNVAVSSAVAGNSPQPVSVTFTVAPSPSPLIALSSTSHGFTAEQGGEDPVAHAIAVANVGAATLNGLTAEVSYTAGEPTDWLIAELSATTAPTILTLTATTGSLGVGSYTASVSIASPIAGNSPQAVIVTFAVTQPPEGLLFAVNTGSAGLSTINPRTGVGRFIGRLGGSNNALFTGPTAMAVTLDHVLRRAVMYVWNNTGDGTGPDPLAPYGRLLTINIGTGEGTPVNAATITQGPLDALAVSGDGSLYGSVSGSFYSVDPATGTLTFIGPHGSGFLPAGMDFHCDGTLYAVELSLGVERLATINPATGAVIIVGTLSQDLGIVGSIAFSSARTLIGSSFGALGTVLFDINTTTGTVTNVRPVSGTNVLLPHGMGFLRSELSCRP